MPSKSILLIEHKAGLRDALGDCLNELGEWEVTLLGSINEGIELCEQRHPDVILVDAPTAENDVIILVEHLKQYSASQAMPIVLISDQAA